MAASEGEGRNAGIFRAHLTSAGSTDRSFKTAESFDVAAIGEPFPALPASLLAQPMAQRVFTKRRRPGIA